MRCINWKSRKKILENPESYAVVTATGQHLNLNSMVKIYGTKFKGLILWYHGKGLVTSNTHVHYESHISPCCKVMAKVKVFQK